MKPVVAEIEPVAERTIHFQFQFVERRRSSISIFRTRTAIFRDPVVWPLGIERTFTELKFVEVFIVAVEGGENGFM